ncbi:HNH endonuclease [Clostridium tarantellae]|uniref:HNH endonuclease n=1 Tax=Clostridium tarantellae TaxID=39493 RepID=A0A6I1MUW1_9CLOT|nr:HNH endonuclease signature motif containing protein [Clostridium tarantellae]MPQ44631.1 HNH endonuclease [Clostridium tarantellae]
MNYLCEICGKLGDIHHIVHKHEGGLDFKLNYKYLCNYHHRGKYGPHEDPIIDLIYKLKLQNSLKSLLPKTYYDMNSLSSILCLNKNSLKRISKNLKIYKEGYLSDDIIFQIMGRKIYSEELIEDFILEKDIVNNF